MTVTPIAHNSGNLALFIFTVIYFNRSLFMLESNKMIDQLVRTYTFITYYHCRYDY